MKRCTFEEFLISSLACFFFSPTWELKILHSCWSQKDAVSVQTSMAGYSFRSCSLHWHREDAPEALPSPHPPASKILKGEKVSKAQAVPTPTASQRDGGGGAETAGQLERTESVGVSDPCRDSAEAQQQEGGILEAHIKRWLKQFTAQR